MCGFQSEVRGRGERADNPLSLCRIPKARRIFDSSQGYLRKAPGNIAESAVLPYSLFPCGGKASRYSPRVPTTHGSPDPSCGKRGEKSRLRTNKTRGQRGGSETLTYVCYDRNLWELNEKKDASAA